MRSMSTLARYANGASFIPFAKSNIASGKSFASSAIDSTVNWTKSHRHTLTQAIIFVAIVGSIGAHLSLQNSQNKADILASQKADTSASVVDELSSSEVAAVVALTTNSMIAEEVVATAEQVDAGTGVTVASDTFISKPAAALTDDKSSVGVVRHDVAKGESLKEIAEQYGISVETLKWANGNAEDITAGDKLRIPPVNGVLYTVKEGDSADDIASKFDADANRIVAFNDAELTGLKAGQKIMIPGGEKEAPTQAATSRIYAAASQINTPVAPSFAGSTSSSFLKHYSQIPANSYAAGWCTHWAAFRAAQLGNPVGKFWGNAISWPSSARGAGFKVGGSPRVGSVGQAGNHVVVVEAVKGNQIKYSDMNGLAGWGNAAMSGWVPASSYVYMHR